MTSTVLSSKISEVDIKSPDDAKYITTRESNKLTAENLAARLKQRNLVSKIGFDNKLISFKNYLK